MVLPRSRSLVHRDLVPDDSAEVLAGVRIEGGGRQSSRRAFCPQAEGDVVFRAFPNKVSCEPDVAGAVVTELRAFFAFARRELGLKRAAAWSRMLGTDA